MQFVKTRISRAIFNNEIPDPRDVIIICLINTCDVFRFMFQLYDEAEERIEFICKMDLIGRSIADAVIHTTLPARYFDVPPCPRRFRPSPYASCCSIDMSATATLPALFADLAKEYGPVFRDTPAVRQAHNLPRRYRDKSLGPSARLACT